MSNSRDIIDNRLWSPSHSSMLHKLSRMVFMRLVDLSLSAPIINVVLHMVYYYPRHQF